MVRPAVAPPLERDARTQTTAADPTFAGSHPLYQRLLSGGWYNTPAVARLQREAARSLRRRPAGNTALDRVGFLALDVEATDLSHGFRRRDGSFSSGWDEPWKIGYSLYHGGRRVQRGTITLQPDVPISPEVAQLTHVTPAELVGAPRFERAARRLLRLMRGRIVVGHSGSTSDWGWLTSAFARLGVDLPPAQGRVLDSYLLAQTIDAESRGLKALAERYGVPLPQHHDPNCDADASFAIGWRLLGEKGARTLDDALRLQEAGVAAKRQRQSARHSQSSGEGGRGLPR